MLKMSKKINMALIKKRMMVERLKSNFLKREEANSEIFVIMFLIVVALALVIIFRNEAMDIVNSVMQSVKTKVIAIFN